MRPLTPAGQIFTIVLILLGVGVVLYNLSVILGAVTVGHLRAYLERRPMDRTIDRMSGHVIVCGCARTGALLLAVRRPGQAFEPNPPGDLVVPSGSVLIVLGTQVELDATTRLGRSD